MPRVITPHRRTDSPAAADHRRGRRGRLQRARLFSRALSGPGHRHSPGRQLAAVAATASWPATPRITRGCGRCSTSISSARCSTAPATVRCGPASSTRRLAWRTNVEGLINLLSIVVERDVRLVHLSIDLVYSGRRASDPGCRLTARCYSNRSHRPGDRLRQDDGRRRATDCRLDAAGLHAADFAADGRQLQRPRRRDRLDSIALQEGRPATLYFDEVRTPAYTDCLNRLYERVLASDLAGLYHAGGPRALSLYQIAQIVNRVGGYDPEFADGLPANRSRADSAAGRQRVDELYRALPHALGDDEPLDAWPYDPALVPTHRRLALRARRLAPARRELLARVLYRNPRRRSLRFDPRSRSGAAARPPGRLRCQPLPH